MFKFFATLFVCFALTINVFAWHSSEHKTTAEIAWRQMTPQVREKAFELLMAAPEDAGILDMAPFAYEVSPEERKRLFFTNVSIWADVLNDPRYPNRKQKYALWTHHINYFWRGTSDNPQDLSEMPVIPKDNDGVSALFAFEKTLRDPAASKAEKAIALAYFVHVGGDIHQPLHTSGHVTETEPEGDRGGNDFSLSAPDTARENVMNLHRYWDGAIQREMPKRKNETDDTYVPQLANRFTKKHPANKFADKLNVGKFDEWAKESFQIVKTGLYPQTLIRNQMPPKTYRKFVKQIAEERIALAGYRMAATLNRALAN